MNYFILGTKNAFYSLLILIISFSFISCEQPQMEEDILITMDIKIPSYNSDASEQVFYKTMGKTFAFYFKERVKEFALGEVALFENITEFRDSISSYLLEVPDKRIWLNLTLYSTSFDLTSSKILISTPGLKTNWTDMEIPLSISDSKKLEKINSKLPNLKVLERLSDGQLKALLNYYGVKENPSEKTANEEVLANLLFHAIWRDHNEIIEWLIQQGASLKSKITIRNSYSRFMKQPDNCLQLLLIGNKYELLEKFLMNKVISLEDFSDKEFRSIIDFPEMIDVLCKYKFPFNEKTITYPDVISDYNGKKLPMLHLLAGLGEAGSNMPGNLRVDCISKVIECGGDINITDSDGNTALHLLFENYKFHRSYIPVATRLIELGINPKQKNDLGQSALDLFETNRKNELGYQRAAAEFRHLLY